MSKNTVIRIFLLTVGNTLAMLLALLALRTIATNLLGWFMLAVSIVYGAGGVIHLWLYADKGDANRSEKGNRSFWWIVPGFIAIFFGPVLDYLYLPPILPRGLTMQLGGLIVIALGLALRIWTRLTLRSLYSGYLRVKVGHVLVTHGPFHWIRHPGYNGFLIMAFGLAIGYSSVVGLVAVILLLLPGLVYRINVEEKLLAEHFGDEYRLYAKQTKRLIPFIW